MARNGPVIFVKEMGTGTGGCELIMGLIVIHRILSYAIKFVLNASRFDISMQQFVRFIRIKHTVSMSVSSSVLRSVTCSCTVEPSGTVIVQV